MIQTLLSGPNQFRFNEIVENRKNYEQKLIFDTIFQVLRIQEMFDACTNKFEQNIEYVDSSGADDGLSMAWSYELIDSLKPRCYTIYLGCIIRKGVPQRVKRWKRKINKMNPVKEPYYIVDTILDKRMETMRISLRISVLAKRELKVFYGPFGKSKRPELESWYHCE